MVSQVPPKRYFEKPGQSHIRQLHQRDTNRGSYPAVPRSGHPPRSCRAAPVAARALSPKPVSESSCATLSRHSLLQNKPLMRQAPHGALETRSSRHSSRSSQSRSWAPPPRNFFSDILVLMHRYHRRWRSPHRLRLLCILPGFRAGKCSPRHMSFEVPEPFLKVRQQCRFLT